MQATPQQQVEIDKYVVAYESPAYRMGPARMRKAWTTCQLVPQRGSLLDVGTGRGEFLAVAESLGFTPVLGVDPVPALQEEGRVVFGLATALPWQTRSWNVVTCFDVLEHLVPEDTEDALKEIARVARHAVVLSVADYPHVFNGVELHVNRRSYEEWDTLIREHVGGRGVTRFPGEPEMWLIRR